MRERREGKREGGRHREGRRFPAFLTHAVLDSFAPFVVITAPFALMRCRGARVRSTSELSSRLVRNTIHTHTAPPLPRFLHSHILYLNHGVPLPLFFT